MSSLWTPEGERPVERAAAAAPADRDPASLSEEELAAHADELRDQLAATPVEAVVAQFAYQLFEVAALHLSLEPAQLDQARLAIDAMGALIEGLPGRMGPDEAPLSEGLANLRMAFVQISAAATSGADAPPSTPPAAP
ncbi:MAG: hypothetical protein QOG03_37 [Actinomycetota bacterium]|jgi:hypothetical protein|nr:hypothetical protein [Actinomycetota bacterium]